MFKNTSILLVEPDQTADNSVLALLKEQTKARVHHAKDPAEALDILNKNNSIHILITDLFPTDTAGLQLIQKSAGKHPALVAIVCLPFGNRRHIVDAFQAGAFFHVGKPVEQQEMLEVLKNAIEYQKLLHQSLNKTASLRKSDGFAGIIGESGPMKNLFQTIERITAHEHGNVLIVGESGTGKELVAKAVHNMTPERSQYNFVPVNCAAIPEDLLESELFGYEKGAFTGANRFKKGRLQHADKGSLFLDEIGDMKPGLQSKLLRVLQEQVFEPIGSVRSIQIDIRVIAATNCDLEAAVKNGAFREDLYYRLSVVPISLPPLRERLDDIPHLINKFLLMYNRGRQNAILDFTPEALQRLKAYDWPGNVRELQNLIQRLCILHGGNRVDVDALPEKFKQDLDLQAEPVHAPTETESSANESLDFHNLTVDFENRLILQALSSTKWNKKEAAKLLNMKRTTLLEKIKKRNLDQHNLA
ncbi:MAG: sigma-54 dependent transcriptional regulator [Desulfohalobiaceae bacterium]|nr:sigma-54 dependent transcriptional regulator [Desulfohalobiaceae bacterium]